MSALEEAWDRYCRSSYVQMAAVAAMAEIDDLAEIENRMEENRE